MLVVLLLLVLDFAAVFVEETAKFNAYWGSMRVRGISPVPTHRSYLDWYAFLHSLMRDTPPFWICWAVSVAWPWVTFAILMIFRALMRCAKVKNCACPQKRPL